jgi:hypothetical protein
MGSVMGQMGLNKSDYGAPMWIRLCAGGLALCLLLPLLFLPFKIQDGHGVWVFLWTLPLLLYGGRFLGSIAVTGVGPEYILWPFESESVKAVLVLVWMIGSLFL